MAIKHHHLQIAEYLITKGANVNAVNRVRIVNNYSYRLNSQSCLMHHMITIWMVQGFL